MAHGIVQTGISFPDGTTQTTAAATTVGVFYTNDQTVTANYTLPTNKNAMTTGPISINDGVTVTISDGSRWVIL